MEQETDQHMYGQLTFLQRRQHNSMVEKKNTPSNHAEITEIT